MNTAATTAIIVLVSLVATAALFAPLLRNWYFEAKAIRKMRKSNAEAKAYREQVFAEIAAMQAARG